MSGTSLDGVDLAYVELNHDDETWHYRIGAAETIPYNETWRIRLSQLHKQPVFLYPKTSAYFGKYLGQLAKQFIKHHGLEVDLISSHGHTIFHQPAEGYTAQIGDGAYIHAETGLPVVCDFRTTDVALGGQGAPLVPIGDQLLFPTYDACLNLGGFANISFTQNNLLTAFDICPCNLVLNRVAHQLNLPYDEEGKIAATGIVNETLLQTLNEIDFYHAQASKSLGIEWVNEVFWPIITHTKDISTSDLMTTLVQHIAAQIAKTINLSGAEKVLVSGGGALNTYLVQQISQKTEAIIHLPEAEVIHFKEALIFALLGVLRVKNLNNSIKSVTGASRNSIGGALYGDFSKLI